MDLTERRAGGSRHPWEVQRFEAYRRVLADHGALRSARVLDVGAGDGWFTDSLAESLHADAETVCWDVNYDDDDLKRTRPGVARTRARPNPGYDLVLALDVLEHIADPLEFITQHLAPLTSTGTNVLVAVPAHQRLFSAHDEALGHFRRYGHRDLLDQLEPWIDIVEDGTLFTSLLAPRVAQVALERIRGSRGPDDEHGVGSWEGGRALTATANAVLGVDARVARRVARYGLRLPGLSHWVFGTVR